jgi:hypothetical protein
MALKLHIPAPAIHLATSILGIPAPTPALLITIIAIRKSNNKGYKL